MQVQLPFATASNGFVNPEATGPTVPVTSWVATGGAMLPNIVGPPQVFKLERSR